MSNFVATYPGTSFRPSLKAPLFSLPSTNPTPSQVSFLSSHQPNSKLRAKPIKATSTRNTSSPYMSTEANFYELLGVAETGTIPEIKQAYKKLARKYHPDVSPPDRVEENTRKFIQVKEAYQTLSDPRSRALYDRDVAAGLHLAFSARNQFGQNEQRSEWERVWRSQLMELQRRSLNRENVITWGTRNRSRKETPIPTAAL